MRFSDRRANGALRKLPLSLDVGRDVRQDIVSLGIPVSIDSMKSDVVAWALDAGAVIANDVWGLQRDNGMAGLLAARNARPSLFLC